MGDLIPIVGPTAIGKTRLAIYLARELDGEIVSADSRQVYRYMDIGTAKPTPEELAAVPHHLISIIDPDQPFTLADFQRLASEAISDIHARGKLPFLVGGTGLYVKAFLEGWQVPSVPPDPAYRQCLEARAAGGDAEGLFQMLAEIDPEAARTIDRRNVRRVIRALEVSRQARATFSSLQRKKPPPLRTLTIGLTSDREEVYRRSDERVDWMVEHGLVDEVRKLLDMGYGFDLPSMSGIGYQDIGLYLKGEITLEEAVRRIKTSNHRFIRHQYAWFRLKDESIHWIDIKYIREEEVRLMVGEFLSRVHTL